jgi:predicted Abi (CAAX) family protease
VDLPTIHLVRNAHTYLTLALIAIAVSSQPMMSNLLITRVFQAFTTVPTWQEWGVTAGVFVAFWQDHSPPQIAQLALTSLIAPALLEELIYRVLLIPHPTEGASPNTQMFWMAASLIIFVVAHPLNALTIYKRANPLFLSPIFLIIATLLGIGLTVLYHLTGSIYPIILIHWVVVFVWLVGLGGNLKLRYYSR